MRLTWYQGGSCTLLLVMLKGDVSAPFKLMALAAAAVVASASSTPVSDDARSMQYGAALSQGWLATSCFDSFLILQQKQVHSGFAVDCRQLTVCYI
jgi:hypothetical protein